MHLQGSLALVGLVACVAACGATNDGQSAVPLATATPDEPGQADEAATLEILSTPSASVMVDGKAAGQTPFKFKVPPGRHDVTFVDDTGPRTMTVTVEPGEARMVKSDRAPGIIEKKHP